MTAQDLIAQRVVRPVYHTARLAWPRTRQVERHYRWAVEFRRKTAAWSVDQREAWMLQRLRDVVRYAFETTEYYRDAWKAIGFDPYEPFDFDVFGQLPILTRSDIQNAVESFRSKSVPHDAAVPMATGGSTGQPVVVWLGPRERAWREAAHMEFMRLLGLRAGDRTALLWGHHLDPVTSTKRVDRLSDYLTNRRWYNCFRLSTEVLDQYNEDLIKYQPAYIVAYASALATLAEHVMTRGLGISYPAKRIVTGAEKLHGFQRAAASRVFGVPIHERYGGRDTGGMAYQYDPGGTLDFTVDWTWGMVEPSCCGEYASILLTKYHADAMPLVRYDTGDAGRFPRSARPGHPAFALHEVIGRNVDRILLPSGTSVHGNHFPHLLKDYPIQDFQVHQGADGAVDLQIVPGRGFDATHLSSIVANLRSSLIGVLVTARVVDEIPRGAASKWRPVTSEFSSVM